jgi:hypothetical protein
MSESEMQVRTGQRMACKPLVNPKGDWFECRASVRKRDAGGNGGG